MKKRALDNVDSCAIHQPGDDKLWKTRADLWQGPDFFLLQACTTFAKNRALQLFLCKLCDCDCANPADPSNHIVANHQQVAFGEIAKLGKKILTPNCAIMIDDVSSITALRGITFLYQRNTVLPSRRKSCRQSTLNDNISLLTDRYYSSQLEPVDATVSTAISLASSGSSSGHHSATSSGSHSDSRGGASPGGHSPQAGKWLAIQSIGWLIEWVLLKQYDQHSQRCHLRIFTANPTFIKQNSNDWSPVIIIDIFLIMSLKFKQVEI